MIVLYGATGYTGALIARHLVRQGLKPVLAGRRAGALEAVAAPLGLDTRVSALSDIRLDGATVLLNCAGPFARTQQPLIEACLRDGVHYTDLAGEYDEHVAAAAAGERARESGVLILPGIGYGIVPSDVLIAHLQQRRPDADRIDLALKTVGGVSRGSAGVVLGNLRTPGVQRIAGHLRPARAGAERLRADFGDGDGPVTVVTNPWRADVASAPAQFARVRTFMTFPAPVRALMRIPHGGLLRAVAARLPEGPSPEALARGRSAVWARVAAPGGGTATASVTGPDAYLFTALTAEACLRRILDGDLQPGHHTPGALWGPGLLSGLPGVQLSDLGGR